MKVGRRETIRRTLRTCRAAVGLSQLAVAEKVGIPEKRYWRIENGYDTPPADIQTKLARTLKVEATALPWSCLEKAS